MGKLLLSAEQKAECFEKILELFRTGEYGVNKSCAKIGVPVSTFYDWLKDSAEYSEAFKIAKHEVLKRRIDSTAQTAEITLKKVLRDGYRAVKKEYTVQTDPDGNAVKTLVREFETTGPPPAALIVFAINRAAQTETEEQTHVVDFSMTVPPEENGNSEQKSE